MNERKESRMVSRLLTPANVQMSFSEMETRREGVAWGKGRRQYRELSAGMLCLKCLRDSGVKTSEAAYKALLTQHLLTCPVSPLITHRERFLEKIVFSSHYSLCTCKVPTT